MANNIELKDFILSDKKYMNFKLTKEKMSFYLNPIWETLDPEANILNMGIMKRTPDCLLYPISSDKIKSIIHVELDFEHKVKISPKETVIWKKDFLKYLLNCKSASFDGVVCWHGPEHLTKNSGEKAIQESIRVSKRWTLISCPWDRLKGWKQQPKGKEHLGHKSVWTEEDFLKFGFKVITIGERKIYPGYLIAWKKI